MLMFLFLLFSVLLLRSFFRLKELFQVKNGLTTSLLFFFFENAKNLGRSDDAKRRKKRGWPNVDKREEVSEPGQVRVEYDAGVLIAEVTGTRS